jgi:hypothetical protein
VWLGEQPGAFLDQRLDRRLRISRVRLVVDLFAQRLADGLHLPKSRYLGEGLQVDFGAGIVAFQPPWAASRQEYK